MKNNIYQQPFFSTEHMYYKFLSTFGEQHTFQTFCDKGKNKKLIKQFHGSIKNFFHDIAKLNLLGAGVFFTVNETNLLGRTSQHIRKVRSVFIDLDGVPLPKGFELQPHLIVNTSPGKYHCYWLVSNMPLESFSLYQEALAKKFNSDPKVKDLPRVMRVAGFFHNKKDKYPIKIIQRLQKEPYTKEEIKSKLSLQRPQKKQIFYDKTYKLDYNGNYTYGANKGDRHEQLVKMLVAIKKRGESYDYAREEALKFARACDPPENNREVMFQLNDIWARY
tara:strand:+ start:685 stop:1515 length:831 start_codon:yes stop_codon:yes gene_type:complete